MPGRRVLGELARYPDLGNWWLKEGRHSIGVGGDGVVGSMLAWDECGTLSLVAAKLCRMLPPNPLRILLHQCNRKRQGSRRVGKILLSL